MSDERDIFWDERDLPGPTRDPSRLKRDMDRWGYCMIAEAVAGDTLRVMRERLEELAETEAGMGDHVFADRVNAADSDNQWILMLVNKGEDFLRAVDHPDTRPILEHLLGPGYLLSESSAHLTRPGNPAMALHTDQWWMPPPVMPGERHQPGGTITREGAVQGPLRKATRPIAAPMVAQNMLFVSDFTEANGATRLVPGSHMTGSQPDQSVPQVVPSIAAEGPAGTIAIWEGRTWHSAGPNTSNETRYGMPTLYAAPQMRTLMNFTLGTRTRIVDEAPERLRQLLGFRIWSGYGSTGEMGAQWARSGDAIEADTDRHNPADSTVKPASK